MNYGKHLGPFAALSLCLMLATPRTANAQGCEFLNPPSVPFWISAEFGGGLSTALSFSKPLVIKQFTPAFKGGVGMNFYNGIRLMLDYQYQSFAGNQSFYDWVTMHQVQLRGLFPLVQSTYVDWHAGPMAGLSFANKKYFLPRRDSEGRLMYVGNTTELDGLLLLTRVPGLSLGLGTRLAVYPIEALSLFVDVTAGYSIALLETLALEEGALVISSTAGVEVHF